MLITIFTPTYNRSHTLPRVFRSLQKQTMKDFEWLIVDDGSTDNTSEIVKGFKDTADFPIRYIQKENGGKHTAHNEAIKLAKGELFFTVDSDDWLPNRSLTLIKELADDLIISPKLAGIVALKDYESGKIIGKPFPKDKYISSLRELEASGNGGERSLVFKTEIIRRYPYPVIEGERFLTESVVYDRIGLKYDFVISNDTLTTCEYQIDGLSAKIKKIMANNPCGYAIYYAQRIELANSMKERIGHMARYQAFRLKTKEANRKYCNYKGKHIFLTSLFMPLGSIVKYLYR